MNYKYFYFVNHYKSNLNQNVFSNWQSISNLEMKTINNEKILSQFISLPNENGKHLNDDTSAMTKLFDK